MLQSLVNTPLCVNVGICMVMVLLSLWRNCFLYAALMFLSATNAALHTPQPVAARAREAVFSGAVISEQPYENYRRLLVHIDRVRVGPRTLPFDETVLFYTTADRSYLGKYLLITGRIKNAMRRQGPHLLSGKIVGAAPGASITHKMQSTANQYIDSVFSTVFARGHADIAGSLILGGSGRVARDVRDAFCRAGVLHILAVSGLHVGFVAVFVGFFLLLVPVPRWTQFVITMLVLISYAAVTGFRPSVCRATAMAGLFGVAILVQRNVRPLHIVNITAMAFLIFEPRTLFDLGTQLSFAAVYGIVILLPVCNENVIRHVHSKLARRVLTIMAVSLSAQLFVSPLLAYYFHRLPTCAVISNCIIVPLTSVAVFLLFACLGIGTVSLAAAHIVGYCGSLVLNAIVAVSSFFASLSFSTIALSISPLLFVPFYLLFFRLTRKAAVFVIISVLILGALSERSRCILVIENAHTSIIAGHGTATMVVTGEKNDDRVQAWLERQNIHEINCLVAPPGCRLPAQRFCQLPDVLQVKRIGWGRLNLEIGNRVLMRYGMVQIPLRNEDANESDVIYTMTDGARTCQFRAPQYGTVVEQMVVDARCIYGKLRFLF